MPTSALSLTAFSLAQRFIGVREVPGASSNPLILALLRLDGTWPENDEVPWCSAFVNWVAWLLRLPRSHSLSARSWLRVGRPITIAEAEAGFDVVVLKRDATGPGPEVLSAPGHVGFFAGRSDTTVFLLGGNQGNEVNVSPYPLTNIIGIRRLL